MQLLYGCAFYLRGDEMIEKIEKRLLETPYDYGVCEDYFHALLALRDDGVVVTNKLKDLSTLIGKTIPTMHDASGMRKLYDLQGRVFTKNANDDFDSYILALEWERNPENKFYVPRRKQLKPLANEMQKLESGELSLLSISLPPGVGKTTLAIFYLSWFGGKHPDLGCLGGSHNGDFLRGVYDEVHRIVTGNGEYRWREIFNVEIVSTNATSMRIDLGNPKRFQTFQFSSIGSGNAGKVRASGLLYCDDLVDGIESALSIERMDKLWRLYSTDLRQRKIGNCAELHIATRWSTYDVIGRLQALFGDSDKSKFISIPALDENDESNFDYKGALGFSTQFYIEQREVIDETDWKALYMNEPIEREGRVYDPDELRRYFELPDGEPDAIIAVCDTKDKGKDFCSLPVAYVYGNDYYIEDVVFDNALPEVVNVELVECLLKNDVQMARFESNSAGGTIAKNIQDEVKKRGGRTKITTKYSTANKETRIIVNSPWVKEHCLFKDTSRYKAGSPYGKFMANLSEFTLIGRVSHDDAPDSMSELSDFAQSLSKSDQAKLKVFKRPF